MTRHGSPVTIRWGSRDPEAPLIVLFHGRDANEKDMAWLAPYLPDGAAYVSVRGPLPEGGGFAWFADKGVGRPLPDSLAVTMAWFREWLDERATPQVPVVLVDFSHGAVFAGGLLLADPLRFAAAGLLYGTLPVDSGVPVTRGRLAGVPVFVTHGVHDTVVPVELQGKTWDYLVQESGSPLWAQREPTSHEVTAKTASELAGWIEARMGYLQRWYLQHHGVTGTAVTDGGSAAQARWPALLDGLLPARPGRQPHPGYDGSLHLVLPIPLAHDALMKGLGSGPPASRYPVDSRPGHDLRPPRRDRAGNRGRNSSKPATPSPRAASTRIQRAQRAYRHPNSPAEPAQ